MKFSQIKETCLYVNDLEKARNFYNGTLGFPIIDYTPDKHLFLRVGSSVLLCFNPEDSRLKVSPPGHFGGGKQHIAFEVAEFDYAEAKDLITSRGVMVTDTVVWRSGKESFYFNDPEGNVLEIVPDRGVWD